MPENAPPPRTGTLEDLQASAGIQSSSRITRTKSASRLDPRGGTSPDGHMELGEINQPSMHSSMLHRPPLQAMGYHTYREGQHDSGQRYASKNGDQSRERGSYRGVPYGQRHYRDKSRGNVYGQNSPYLGNIATASAVQADPGPAGLTFGNQRQFHSLPVGMRSHMIQPTMVPHQYYPGSFGPMTAQQAIQSTNPIFGYMPTPILGVSSPNLIPYASPLNPNKDPTKFMIQAPLGSHISAPGGPPPSLTSPGLIPYSGFFEQSSFSHQRTASSSRDGTMRSHPRKPFTDDARVLQSPMPQAREYNSGSPRHQRSFTSHDPQLGQRQVELRRSQRSSGGQPEQSSNAPRNDTESLGRSVHGNAEYFGYAVQPKEGEATGDTVRISGNKHPSIDISGESSATAMSPLNHGVPPFYTRRSSDSFHNTTGQVYQRFRAPYSRDKEENLDLTRLFVSGSCISDDEVRHLCAPFNPPHISRMKRDISDSPSDGYGYCFVR